MFTTNINLLKRNPEDREWIDELPMVEIILADPEDDAPHIININIVLGSPDTQIDSEEESRLEILSRAQTNSAYTHLITCGRSQRQNLEISCSQAHTCG